MKYIKFVRKLCSYFKDFGRWVNWGKNQVKSLSYFTKERYLIAFIEIKCFLCVKKLGNIRGTKYFCLLKKRHRQSFAEMEMHKLRRNGLVFYYIGCWEYIFFAHFLKSQNMAIFVVFWKKVKPIIKIVYFQLSKINKTTVITMIGKKLRLHLVRLRWL